MSMDRDELLRTLVMAMEAMNAVLALWEDGSASFGRTDAFSDIDLAAIVEMGHVDGVAEATRSLLSRMSAIAREYRQTTYHGDTQYIWQLDGMSPFHFVDLTLIERSMEAFRIDRGMHGDPIIHFDKGDCIAVVEENGYERRTRIRERVERIAAVADLQPLLVRKYIMRGEPLHAYGTYQRWMIQPLVELLRIKHCPERSSFHTTYLMWDLPSNVTENLQAVMMVADLQGIDEGLPVVENWIRTLIDQLRRELTSE